jgi:hypothetical protein
LSKTLLLTGTIDPTNNLSDINNLCVRNTKVRLNQYISAITKYIQESVFEKIVFVETTNYPFDYLQFSNMAKGCHKQFEYITFLGNSDMVRTKGKSYGEAEAILYAINNSELLAGEETIYKVTGRIFLKNSKQIVKNKDNVRNEFISYTRAKKCVTYFFKFNKADYLKYFINSQNECDESKNIDIETVFYNIIKNTDIEVKPFCQFPKIDGVIGGVGRSYNKKAYEYFLLNVMIKFGVLSIK